MKPPHRRMSQRFGNTIQIIDDTIISLFETQHLFTRQYTNHPWIIHGILNGLSMDNQWTIHGWSMDIHGDQWIAWIIHGPWTSMENPSMDIYAWSIDSMQNLWISIVNPWTSMDHPWWWRGLICSTSSIDQTEFFKQLGGAPGPIKDHFNHDLGQSFEVSWTFVGRSRSTFRKSWTSVG